jgi:hypothetical protein
LLCPLTRGFKVYELPKMRIKLISGDLPGEVVAADARNEEILIIANNDLTNKQTLYKFKFLHILSKQQLDNPNNSKCLWLEILGNYFLYCF